MKIKKSIFSFAVKITLIMLITACRSSVTQTPSIDIQVTRVTESDSFTNEIRQVKTFDQCDSSSAFRTDVQFSDSSAQTNQQQLVLGAEITGGVDLPNSVKLELKGSIEKHFSETNQQERAHVESASIEVPAHIKQEYTITWQETRRNGTVEYMENGQAKSTNYSYRIALELISALGRDLPCLTPLAETAASTEIFVSTPTGTSTPPILKAGHIVRSEHFDNLSTLSFSMFGVANYEIEDGLLILTDKIANNGDPWSDGDITGRSNFSPQAGNVSVFLFKVEENTFFGFHYELYDNTNEGVLYRGINLDGFESNVSLHIDKGYGDNHTSQQSVLIPQLKGGIWYFYALQVQPGGYVTVQLREKDQPDRLIFNNNFQLDEGWTKPGFTFVIIVDQGKMEIDEYQELEITDAK